jgi:hypothetical protein
MALVIYHHHTIVSTPVCDDNTGMWKFAAAVSSGQSGSGPQRLHFITASPQLFIRFEDAEQAGLEAAKNQVDSNCWKGAA